MTKNEKRLSGLYRTIGKPYGVAKKKKKDTDEKVFVPEKLQPLFFITENKFADGSVLTTAKFAKNVSPEEWRQYPRYNARAISRFI